MQVNEIFNSIQGEGSDTGKVTTFIRFSGCNLSCSYCDTDFELSYDLAIHNILSKVKGLGNKYVCITGGEPLLQQNLCKLIDTLTSNYMVSIETNGTIDISELLSHNVKIVMDIKCPSANLDSDVLVKTGSNIAKLRPSDEVKFVIANEDDYRFAKKILPSIPCKVYFSPVFESDWKWLPQKIVEDGLDVTFMLQLHKIIGMK